MQRARRSRLGEHRGQPERFQPKVAGAYAFDQSGSHEQIALDAGRKTEQRQVARRRFLAQQLAYKGHRTPIERCATKSHYVTIVNQPRGPIE